LVMCYSYILSNHLYYGHVLQLFIISSSVLWSCVTALYYIIICIMVMCYSYILSNHLYFGHVLQLYII